MNTIIMSTDHDPFTSTEAYYAQYRPGYGEQAIEHLRDQFQLDETSRVLDLGCGAGQLGIPVSEHVGTVVGMDPNERMLQEARSTATESGRTNVEWTVGSDADLSEDLGPFDLTTMGRSFHWMNQERTLDRLYRMTKPGGGIALLSDTEWFTRGTRAWQDVVYEAADEYVDGLPERTGPIEEYQDPWDELIRAFGFVGVNKHEREFEREWTIDEIVGYCFSLSFCSPATFDGETDAFEADVRGRLADFDRNEFRQTECVRIISGRKPDTNDC